MDLKRAVVVLAVLAASAVTMQPRAEWSGLASPGFTYCYVNDPCTEFCELWELGVGQDCSQNCDVIGENPEVPCGAGGQVDVSSALAWSIAGHEFAALLPSSNVSMSASGERFGPSNFVVSGSSSIIGAAEFEVAVFRYSGDPSVFDGLSAATVFDFVDSGIIDVRDVLLAETTPSLGGSFSFEVDVTGLADGEIVLMTTGAAVSAPSDVPATRPLFVVGLAIILVALGTAITTRRRAV